MALSDSIYKHTNFRLNYKAQSDFLLSCQKAILLAELEYPFEIKEKKILNGPVKVKGINRKYEYLLTKHLLKVPLFCTLL